MKMRDKVKNRLSVMIFCLIVVFSLAGCGSGSNDTDMTDTDQTQTAVFEEEEKQPPIQVEKIGEADLILPPEEEIKESRESNGGNETETE